MKKYVIVSVVVIVVAIAYGYKSHRVQHDPHYDAAVCVAMELPGANDSEKALFEAIRTVIINENSSYSLKQVTYDEQLSQSSVKKYQQLSAEQKIQASKDTESCIAVMADARAGS